MQMQSISRWVYFIIVLMEAFQIFWLIYYQVICRNGFANNKISTLEVDGYLPKLLSQLQSLLGNDFNSTYQENKVLYMISSAQTAVILDTTFRMDDLTKWSNPALYFIETDYNGAEAVDGVSGSNTGYYTALGLMCGVFYLIIGVFALGSNLFFKVAKRENYKESIKVVMRVIAVVQYLYASYLAVPFMTLLLQAF